MNGPEVTGVREGELVDPSKIRPWNPLEVNWAAVRADVLEKRDEFEGLAQQIVAEARAENRGLTLADQENRARLQEGIDTCEELIADIDETVRVISDALRG